MTYVPGEERISSEYEDEALLIQVLDDIRALIKRQTPFADWINLHMYGSTRFNSHGYIGGFSEYPDISVLRVKYPQIEFDMDDENKPTEFHDEDKFSDNIIRFRIKGSTGWHGEDEEIEE